MVKLMRPCPEIDVSGLAKNGPSIRRNYQINDTNALDLRHDLTAGSTIVVALRIGGPVWRTVRSPRIAGMLCTFAGYHTPLPGLWNN